VLERVFYYKKGHCTKVFLYNYIVSLQKRIPLEEVFQHLQQSKDGLTSKNAHKSLVFFGHKKLEERRCAKSEDQV
jgi:hypothetical protein